jgi:predicted esterase
MQRSILFLLLVPCLAFGQAAKTKQSYTVNGFKVEFWKFEPGATAATKRPVIIFLHGLGTSSIDAVLGTGLAKAINTGVTKIPFVVLAPYSFSGWWDYKLYTGPLLDWIAKQPDLDPNRVYLTGLSAGGNGTYTALVNPDDRIAAYVPISINSNSFTVPINKCRPVWHFHGGKDGDPNRVATSEGFITRYAAKCPGMEWRTVFTGLGHNAWDVTYQSNFKEPHTGDPFNKSIYDWMLQYTLNRVQPPVDPPVDPTPISQVIFDFYYKNDSVFFVLEGSKKVFKVKVEAAKP